MNSNKIKTVLMIILTLIMAFGLLLILDNKVIANTNATVTSDGAVQIKDRQLNSSQTAFYANTTRTINIYPNGTYNVTSGIWWKNPNVFCIERNQYLNGVMNYKVGNRYIINDKVLKSSQTGSKEFTFKENAGLAYILSFPTATDSEWYVGELEGKNKTESPSQIALWNYYNSWFNKVKATGDKDLISNLTTNAQKDPDSSYVYDEAVAYAGYMDKATKTSSLTSQNASFQMSGDKYKVGPFKVDYNYGSTTSTVNGSKRTTVFGTIDNIYVTVVKDGKEEVLEYKANGNKTGKFDIETAGQGTIDSFPKPGNFYIILADTQIEKISDVKVKFKSLHVKADFYEFLFNKTTNPKNKHQTVIIVRDAERYYEYEEKNVPLDIYTTMDIGGIVFEDGGSGKINEGNSIYNVADDRLVPGVIVTLYDSEGNLATPLKGTNPTITDSNGYYQFKGVLRNKKYYVKFTYDGQIYTNVDYMAGGVEKWDINSKACELSADRAALNTRYSSIGAYPNSYKSSNSLGYGLEYNIAFPKYTDTTRSVLTLQEVYNQITKLINNYIAKNGKFPDITKEIYPQVINDLKNDPQIRNKLQFIEDCKINAYTGVNDKIELYPNDTANTEERLDRINLGIKQRGEFDLMINKDLFNATVQINGKSETYTYNARENLGEKLWELSVRSEDAYNTKYIREIYESDYTFRIKDYDNITSNVTGIASESLSEDLELKVFVTYKLTIRNQSQVAGAINELADYYDNEYTYKSAYIGDKSGNKIQDINFREDANNTSSKYNKIITNDLSSKTLEANQYLYIYVTFEVNKDANGIILDDENTAKYNYVEITGYGNSEGLIDRDSIAGNYNPDKPDINNEDDNGDAPGLVVKLKDSSRLASGGVWEDERTETAEEAKVGNGIKDDGEKQVAGVIVQLIEQKGDKLFVWQEAMTDDNGNYNFEGFIPGDYQIRFIYGDGKETVLTKENGGKNDVSYNGQDYKSTTYVEKGNAYWYTENTDKLLSDARDSWERRQIVNNYSKVLTNHVSEVLASPYRTPDNEEYINELIDNTAMVAYTDNMSIEIEVPGTDTSVGKVTEYKVNNIDFGLEVRPKADLKLVKDVANVKLTLANGTILFNSSEADTNLTWNKPTVDSDGQVILTVDDELIHGSTLEITYKLHIENIGEVDYEGKDFYYTGKYDGSNKVSTVANEVVDYVENNLSFDKESNPNWSVVEDKEVLHTDKLIRDDIDLSTYDVIIRANDDSQLKKATVPGESTPEENVVLVKVLTTSASEDTLSYDNSAEITKTTSTNGRKLETSVPGNYDPTDGDNQEEPDTDHGENVIVLPPFGQQVIYYVVGIVVAVILAVGIVLIKKKVIRK